MRRNRHWRKGRRCYQALYWGADGLYTLTVSAQRCAGREDDGFISFRPSLRGRLVQDWTPWHHAAAEVLREGYTALYTPCGVYYNNNEGRIGHNGRRYYTFWRRTD